MIVVRIFVITGVFVVISLTIFIVIVKTVGKERFVIYVSGS